MNFEYFKQDYLKKWSIKGNIKLKKFWVMTGYSQFSIYKLEKTYLVYHYLFYELLERS